MNRYIKYIVILLISITAYSCVKQDRDQLLAKQEEDIDRYIKGMNDKRIERLNGSNRIVIDEGSKDTVAATGDSVYFVFAGYTFTGRKDKLFYTNSKKIAESNKFPLLDSTDTICGRLAGDPELIPGLASGLVGVGLREHAEIVFSAEYGFYKHPVYNVPKMSALLFEVWIEKIVKQGNK